MAHERLLILQGLRRLKKKIIKYNFSWQQQVLPP